MPMNNHSDNLFDSQAPLEDEKLWDLLSLYVDGEADPAQAAIVEQMLSSDPAYRRNFDFLMQTSKSMHALEEVAPPIGLRDAIYAGTVRRSTRIGRLRAAWNRATAPGFGRYAAFGGAFAVAALGVLLVLPRLTSAPSQRTQSSTVAAIAPTLPQFNTAPHEEVVSIAPEIVKPNPPVPFKSETPKLVVYHKATSLPHVVLNKRKPLDRNVLLALNTTLIPRSHPLPKNNVARTDASVATVGYPYDKKMDEDKGHGQRLTIVTPTGDDFGPMVATNDDPATSHAAPTAALGNTGETGSQPAPQPKQTVHVATLPPGAGQNIAAAVIRHNITAKYSGYDRNVAENIQRHEVTIDVIKGTF